MIDVFTVVFGVPEQVFVGFDDLVSRRAATAWSSIRPSYFGVEVVLPEDFISHNFDVMADLHADVDAKAASIRKQFPHDDQSWHDHRQIRRRPI